MINHVPSSGGSHMKVEISHVNGRVVDSPGEPIMEKSPSGPERKPRNGKRPRIPRMKKWTIVLVEWLDAVKELEMTDSEADFKCVIRRSVGHFLKKNGEIITIAMEDDRDAKDEGSDCDNITSIPLGMVKQVTVLVPKHPD